MRPVRRRLAADRAGAAALEFAIIAPLLLMVFGGIADFGRLLISNGQLANGLAQTVGYALMQGPSVSRSVIASMAKDASARSGVATSVSVMVTGPACYCLSGQPAALNASSPPLSDRFTCTGACPSPALAPGAYMTITTSCDFVPLMPFYSRLVPTRLVQTATIRLQ